MRIIVGNKIVQMKDKSWKKWTMGKRKHPLVKNVKTDIQPEK